jgi:preprotein translocase subunit SecB
MRVSVKKITSQKWTVELEVNLRQSSEPTEAFYMNMVNKSSVFILKNLGT